MKVAIMSIFRPTLVITILAAIAIFVATQTRLLADSQTPTNFKQHPAKALAEAYGVDSFKQIKEISWTFDVTIGKKHIERHWTWEPESGKVTLKRKGHPTLAYNHKQVISSSGPKPIGPQVLQADKWFVNDAYWLLYPFQIHWSNPQVTVDGKANLPIGSGQAQKVVVQFPTQGGYTPGDKYELFLNDQHHIVQWVYHRAGKNPGRPATWQKNVMLGPIMICTEHKGPEGKFELKMTDLSATLDNGKTVKPVAVPEPAKK